MKSEKLLVKNVLSELDLSMTELAHITGRTICTLSLRKKFNKPLTITEATDLYKFMKQRTQVYDKFFHALFDEIFDDAKNPFRI